MARIGSGSRDEPDWLCWTIPERSIRRIGALRLHVRSACRRWIRDTPASIPESRPLDILPGLQNLVAFYWFSESPKSVTMPRRRLSQRLSASGLISPVPRSALRHPRSSSLSRENRGMTSLTRGGSLHARSRP